MNREIKIGVVCILVGICIPLVLLPFTSGFSRDKGFVRNLYEVRIVLNGERQADAAAPAVSVKKFPAGFGLRGFMPTAIPFRFAVALAVILVALGIIRIDKARRREVDEE